MAKTLIGSLIIKFEPEKYENDYHKQVVKMIEDKAGNEEIVVKPADTSPHFVDLMQRWRGVCLLLKKLKAKRKFQEKLNQNKKDCLKQ